MEVRLEAIIRDTLTFTTYRRGKLVLLGDAINGIQAATGGHITYLQNKKV